MPLHSNSIFHALCLTPLAALLACGGLAWHPAPASAMAVISESKALPIEGEWKVVSQEGVDGVRMSTKQAGNYKGKTARITSSGVSFMGQACQTRYSEAKAQNDQTVYASTCSIPGFTNLVLIDAETMLLEVNGVFFTLEKQ